MKTPWWRGGEGWWIQLMFDRRVVWMTEKAYGLCYLGLDESARLRVDRALAAAGQSRWNLADLTLLSR